MISAEDLPGCRRCPYPYPSSFFISFSVYFIGDELPLRVFRVFGGVS